MTTKHRDAVVEAYQEFMRLNADTMSKARDDLVAYGSAAIYVGDDGIARNVDLKDMAHASECEPPTSPAPAASNTAERLADSIMRMAEEDKGLVRSKLVDLITEFLPPETAPFDWSKVPEWDGSLKAGGICVAPASWGVDPAKPGSDKTVNTLHKGAKYLTTVPDGYTAKLLPSGDAVATNPYKQPIYWKDDGDGWRHMITSKPYNPAE